MPELNDGARLLAEDLDEVLIDVAGRVLGHHRHEIKLIDLRAPGLLIAGVETAHVAAHAGARRETIDADHLGAFFGSRADRKETARAAADNEHIGGIGRGDALISNLRRLAEPSAPLETTSTGISPLACAMHLPAAFMTAFDVMEAPETTSI